MLTVICGRVVETATQIRQHRIELPGTETMNLEVAVLSVDGKLFLERRLVISRGLFTY